MQGRHWASVGYILQFEFWAHLLDFGQRGLDAQGVSDGCDALGCVGAIPRTIKATELIVGKIQL